ADREQIDPQFTREPGEPSPCDAGRYSSEELGRHHERENATVLERRQCRQEYRQPEVRHAREGKSEVTRQHARCRDVIRRHELKPDKGRVAQRDVMSVFSPHLVAQGTPGDDIEIKAGSRGAAPALLRLRVNKLDRCDSGNLISQAMPGQALYEGAVSRARL